jgi:hypothetical protein
LTTGLTNFSGWVAYLVIAALMFGETAVFAGVDRDRRPGRGRARVR